MDRKTLGTLAGASALGIGIGLQRSQFAVLADIMSADNWFTNSSIGVLSGLSLAGYILGCIHQSSISNELANIRTVRIGLALGVLSFFIEPLIDSFTWQVIWRIVAGWSSAQLVTGIPGLAIRFHGLDNKRRALAYIFAGAGFAALVASVVVSLVASTNIIESWVTTGIIAVVLAIPIHNLLDICIEEELEKRYENTHSSLIIETQPVINQNSRIWTKSLRLLAGSTLFFGASQVSILTYYPLLLVSRFNVSAAIAESSFANFGLGYTIGAIISGYMPKKYSTDLLMSISAAIGVAGAISCAIGPTVPLVGIGALAFAFWNGSMMGLLLDRINQSVPKDLARSIWSRFSLILSVGFLAFTFISSPFANHSVVIIVWIGAALAGIHLLLQHLASKESDKIQYKQFSP